MIHQWYVPLTFLEVQRTLFLLRCAAPQSVDRDLTRKLNESLEHIVRWNTRQEARRHA